MSHISIRNVQQQDVMLELKFFTFGSTQQNGKCNQVDLTKTALSLLKKLPATRDAVLYYLCRVFKSATQNFIVRIETEIITGQLPPASEDDETMISEIHTVISSFIAANAEAWAPIISTWSLELLGEISTTYARRAHMSTSVNETLQLWMSCRATRTLIDITTQCLSSLIHSDTEACINALLDTSVKHSPYFDWVVAHVGSCFPTTVITRVLSCGLKDFCQHKTFEQGYDAPKTKSVVGILGHLAGSHCDNISTALIDLFTWSLQPITAQDVDVKPQKKATIPFLLQLADLSDVLLLAMSRNIEQILTVDVIVRFCKYIDDLCKYFGAPQALQEFMINLLMKCEIGGVQIIKILLNCMFMENCENDVLKCRIKSTAGELLDYFLREVDLQLRHYWQNPNVQIKILDSFIREQDQLYDLLLSSERIKIKYASKIICFIGKTNPAALVKSCVILFKNAKTEDHLMFFMFMLSSELLDKTKDYYTEKGGHLGVILDQVFSTMFYKSVTSESANTQRMWMNLLTLLRWEKSNLVPMFYSKLVSRAIYANLTLVTKLFKTSEFERDEHHTIAELLDVLDIPSTEGHQSYAIPFQAILYFTSATVNYFFICCNETDTIKQLIGYSRTYSILRKLTLHSKVAKTLALNELLERALFTADKVLFGALPAIGVNDNNDKLLLEQNRKNNKTIPITKNSSVLNGGIIGHGKRKSVDVDGLSKEVVAKNVEQFMRAIIACCQLPQTDENKSNDLSLDSLTSLSLLLVQFISPNVMYNGLPWPEEEFCKVTIERDFYIRRLFNNTPLLWDLLSLVAIHRPTLCYCSVLLRAITATLIHQWHSTSDQSRTADMKKYSSLLDVTTKVIDTMSLGQLLPPPLSGIRDVIPYLKCIEIVQILRDCIWNYMRDHVPSPALFTCDASGIYWRDPSLARPPEIYTTTLRIIMQKNIKTVGHLYSHMFINIPQED